MTKEAIRTRDQPLCPVTGQRGDVLYEELPDGLWNVPGRWQLRANLQSATATAWLDPTPDVQDLPKLYQRYYTHAAAGGRWASLHPARFAMRAGFALPLRLTGLYRQRIRQLDLCLSDATPGRVLDVGCGRGDQLARLRRLGWQVEGQEIDASAAQVARERYGLTVHNVEIEHLTPPGVGYDAVTLSHVVEHVLDPIALLRRCRELLRPGGRLVCVTPNLLSLGHRRWGRHWRDLDPPRHLVLFSAAALRYAAEAAGLHSICVTSSCANAEVTARGSFDLARSGRHHMHDEPSLAVEWAGKAFQLEAWRAHRNDPMSGEELILEASN